MELVANVTDDIRIWGTGCVSKNTSLTATYSVFFLDLLCIHLATKFLHEFLRRYGQPRIVSEFIVGMIVGNVKWIDKALERHVGHVLNVVGQFSMMCYMFVVGLEMDPRTMLLRRPGWEAITAYTGIFSTFVLAFAFFPLIGGPKLNFTTVRVVTAVALVSSNTASPILTRLTTDLKIGRSRIGRLVVRAAIVNDMVITLVVSVGYAIWKSPYIDIGGHSNNFLKGLTGACWALFVIFAQTMFILVVVPRFAEWINDRNPEGKPMKGFDLAISLAVVVALTQFAGVVNFDLSFNSFLVGLAFPKEGRLSSMLISKINFIMTTFGLPFYLCSIGTVANLGAFVKGKDKHGWRIGFLLSMVKLTVVGVIAMLGKVSGTFVASMCNGFQFTESVAIGLLLNVKGYFHILCSYLAHQNGFIDENMFVVLLFDIICTVLFVPLVVRVIVKRARRALERPQMTLQGLGKSAEVQIVIGILGPQNVPTAMGIVEATRSQSTVPLTVYAIDLVDMTESAAAALVPGQDANANQKPIADEAVARMREETSLAFERYVQEGGEGITVVRLFAISAFFAMHEDLCRAAQETASVLIVMPFHRTQRTGDGIGISHPGLRHVNRKVLHHAPCSVGIFVDRGLGRWADNATPSRVAVIFIGGCDDREALVLAGRIALHRNFVLTAVRFLPESGAETKLARTRGLVIEKTLQEKEMHLDDESFAKFFENHIAGGKVGYLEKYIGSGADAVVLLRSLESQYSLFVVGRGGSRNPVLTAGMGDWAECPELGPVGDILSASDFSATASVLIVQQHDVERDQDAAEEDYAFN